MPGQAAPIGRFSWRIRVYLHEFDVGEFRSLSKLPGRVAWMNELRNAERGLRSGFGERSRIFELLRTWRLTWAARAAWKNSLGKFPRPRFWWTTSASLSRSHSRKS